MPVYHTFGVWSDIWFLHVLQRKMLLTYVRSVVQNVEICLLPVSSCISNRQIKYVFAHILGMHVNKYKVLGKSRWMNDLKQMAEKLWTFYFAFQLCQTSQNNGEVECDFIHIAATVLDLVCFLTVMCLSQNASFGELIICSETILTCYSSNSSATKIIL